jgi:hypothetical protein
MLVCLRTGTVLGVVNLAHEQAWYLKDLAYYPNSNHKFVSCGINEVMSWRLIGNQLTYGALPCALIST